MCKKNKMNSLVFMMKGKSLLTQFYTIPVVNTWVLLITIIYIVIYYYYIKCCFWNINVAKFGRD